MRAGRGRRPGSCCRSWRRPGPGDAHRGNCRPTISPSSSAPVASLLLVLDNCEHLLDAGAQTWWKPSWRRCPFARVLATSREALDIPGERVVRLRSLALPAAGAGSTESANGPTPPGCSSSAPPRTGITGRFDASDAPAIVEICRRLDGIPLAIELAAARTAALSPSEIAGLLDERFRLLTGGRRSVGGTPPHPAGRHRLVLLPARRHRTEVFDRLGVFPAAFDAAAAQAVAPTRSSTGT